MKGNTISNLKTVSLQSQSRSGVGILMGLDIPDPDSFDPFVHEIAEKFKLQRMCSPPETDTLLITIIGTVPAARFVKRWREIAEEDGILKFFMSQMRLADVVRGTPEGKPLETVSLIDAPPVTTPPVEPVTVTPIFSSINGLKGYDSDVAYKRWQGRLGTHLAEARGLYAKRGRFGFPFRIFNFRRIVWGVFTRAFWPIYQPGKNNHNGSVVISFDPFFADSPGLFEISEDLRRLRETPGEPKHLKRFAGLLRDDYRAPNRLLIPEEMAGGRKTFFQSIFIPRNRLPGGYLRHRLVPVLASPLGSSAQILRLKYWPNDFQKAWQLGGPLLAPETLAQYQRQFPRVKP